MQEPGGSPHSPAFDAAIGELSRIGALTGNAPRSARGPRNAAIGNGAGGSHDDEIRALQAAVASLEGRVSELQQRRQGEDDALVARVTRSVDDRLAAAGVASNGGQSASDSGPLKSSRPPVLFEDEEHRENGEDDDSPKRLADTDGGGGQDEEQQVENGRLSHAPSYAQDAFTNAYEFQASLWLSLEFAFTEEMGFVASIYVVFFGLLCMAMQILFSLLVLENFATSSYDPDTIAGFELWRVTVGHDARFISEIASSSLVSRVCSGDTSLELGNTQATTVEQVELYIPSGGDTILGSAQGRLMTIMALIAWICTVIREMSGFVDNFRVMRARCRRGPTTIMRTADGFVLESVSIIRMVLVCCVNAGGLGLALFMLWCGSLYIVYTIDLRDLLLNAVALEFVLVIDTLLFEALAPRSTATLMKALLPLDMSDRCSWHGLDCQVMAFLVGALLFLGRVLPFELEDEVSQRQEALRVLCGGNQNFVLSETAMPYPFFWAGTVEHQVKRPGQYSKQMEGVKGLADYDDAGLVFNPHQGLELPTVFTGAWSLRSVSTWNPETAINFWNPNCLDILGEDQGFLPQETLMELLHEEMEGNISSCAAVGELCDTDDLPGYHARSQCPQTCGCDTPESPLVVRDPESGCPTTCQHLEKYQLALAQHPCADTPKEAGAWKDMLEKMIVLEETYPKEMQIQVTGMRETLQQRGCAGIVVLRIDEGLPDLCDLAAFRPMRSFRFLCPVTCLCKGEGEDCPHTCKADDGQGGGGAGGGQGGPGDGNTTGGPAGDGEEPGGDFEDTTLTTTTAGNGTEEEEEPTNTTEEEEEEEETTTTTTAGTTTTEEE